MYLAILLSGTRDLSFPARDQTHGPRSGSGALTTGPSGKSLNHIFKFILTFM